MKLPCVSVFLFVALVSTRLFAQDNAQFEATVEMLSTRVLVVNSEGEPLEGAVVMPVGLRTNDDPGSHYGWMPKEFGAATRVETGSDGIAEVVYPRFVEEKKPTSAVTWSIVHPEYAPFRDDLSVASPPGRVELKGGYRIAATAINSDTGNPIKTDLFGLVSSAVDGQWNLKNGVLISRVFAEEQSALRIIHIPDEGPMLFSDLLDAPSATEGSRAFLKNVELKRGVEVRGKLDESIPRPIKNGHVCALIVSRLDGAERNYLTDCDWWDTAKINEDGTFVFPSLPRGEVLQMISVCDGFVATNPDAELAKATFGAWGEVGEGFTYPQFVQLDREIVSPVLRMAKAASLKVLILDQDGNPVPDCKVHMWPNQLWFESGSQVLGSALETKELLKMVRRGEDLSNYVREPLFSATTNGDGRVTIGRLPGNRTEGISVEHDLFELPAQDNERTRSIALQAGEVHEITLQLQPKGTDSIGSGDLENEADH